MKNALLSAVFDQMADLMEILGEDRFRVNSYRRVARVIGDLGQDVEVLLASGELGQMPGIGKSSLAKVEQFVQTGEIAAHQDLLQKVPASLLDLLKVPGMGPKGVKAVFEQLRVTDLSQLKAAIASGALAALAGFGDKKAAALAKGVEFLERSSGRIRLDQATYAAALVMGFLEETAPVEKIVGAGSLRRSAETIGDVDLLMTLGKGSAPPDEVLAAFTKAPFVKEPLAAGTTKASAVIEVEGCPVQVDVRVVPVEGFGAALQYFTGSKQHNVRLRELATKRGLKLNEYGLFPRTGEEVPVAGSDEPGVYEHLGLGFIDPLLREDRGEIEAAVEGRLPALVRVQDIRGDLHAHTEASDGAMTLEDLAEICHDLGYAYVAVTDHSKTSAIANGLDARRLARQIEEVQRLNAKLKGVTLLAGSEVDILADGRLDFEDSLLAELDFVIASIHSGLNSPSEKVMLRTLKAMDNPFVNCIGHPTGRLLGERDAMALDMTAVVAHAAQTGTALEVNANPRRLDLKDIHCRMAVEAGVPLVISTDSHHPEGFQLMGFGVACAGRGWATKADILNTQPLDKVRRFVRNKRPR